MDMPKHMEKVNEYLGKLEAQMPAELLDMARSMSNEELLRDSLHRAVDDVQTLMRLYAQAQDRCAVCRDNGRQCGHCFAEEQVCEQLLQGTVTLALLAKVATGPGSRIAAERERQAEQTANAEKAVTS